ncbi:MAG: serine/threonine protein kinase, partial [Bacteroidota bacterium]
MAEVYTGTHDSIGEVAVKVMRGMLEKDSEQLARFRREAQVIEGLRHPNIVQMFYYDVVEENPYLVMEYIPGPSLALYLKSLHDNQQRMPIGMVAHILSSLASALDYAHARGVVHRDIKPANVLLRSKTGEVRLEEPLPEDAEPVLTDFGLVRLLDSTMHTTAGSVSGTPTYMSPEQARGEKVDKRSDIYSLGIMLYEMLAGTVPFQADTTFGMLMKHINEPLPPIPGISMELQAILDRTLAKDPALRYESAGELASEFYALFNGQTISPGTIHLAQLAREAADAGKQPPPPPDNGRPANRWLRIGLEALAVIILAIVLVQVFRLNPTNTAITATPDLNAPVGRLRFDDNDFYVDKADINLAKVQQPENGKHLEAWFKGEDGTIRDLGKIDFASTGSGRLTITEPDSKNFLSMFNQLMITLEEDDTSVTQPTGDILYSSVLPPKALVEMKKVLVSYDQVPDKGPLMQNLWWYNVNYVNRSINGDPYDTNYKVGIVQAYQNKDEATLRKKTEEVINAIVGEQSDQYKDYNGDGNIDNAGDGFGSLPNGNSPGYLQATILNSKNAADATDSTLNIRKNAENVNICLTNVTGWTEKILTLALQLNDTPFGSQMEPIVNKIASLGNTLLKGEDANKNGQYEAIPGECGATDGYYYGYWMADMFIYPGQDRVPP